MDVAALMSHAPFVDHLGIDVTEAADGHAEAELPLEPEHSMNPGGIVAHGGVTYALADTVGGAAVISLSAAVSPTIDMRIDYLAPATADLTATADVIRFGGAVGVADVEVHDDDGHHVATARGVYKTAGQGEATPWTEGVGEDVDPGAIEDAYQHADDPLADDRIADDRLADDSLPDGADDELTN